MALPALTLTLVVLAHMMRMTRAAVIERAVRALHRDGPAQGRARPAVVLQHALPNALAPIATVVALNLAYLVVGVVVVEVVFVYPGMGQYMVDAVAKRDVPVVQACTHDLRRHLCRPQPHGRRPGIVANPRLRHPR